MKILSEEEARWLLYRKTQAHGKVAEFARTINYSAGVLSAMRNGHDGISKRVAAALGLKRAWILDNPKDEELFNVASKNGTSTTRPRSPRRVGNRKPILRHNGQGEPGA